MNSNNISVQAESIIQQEIDQREKQEKVMQTTILHNMLHQMLGQIGDLCNQVGHTDGKGGAQKAEGNNALGATSNTHKAKADPAADDPASKALKNGQIFLALLLILFDGPNSSYSALAGNMGDLQKILAELKKLGDDTQTIQNAIKDIMNGKGTQADLESLATAETNMQKMLTPASIKELHLSPALVSALKAFSDPETGDLDQLLNKATGGRYTNWQDIAKDPAGRHCVDQIQKYITGVGGGAIPKPATTALSDLSNLMGSIQSQNNGQVQELSMLEQKVNSDAQLFSSTVTLMKSMAQVLTNYSGS